MSKKTRRQKSGASVIHRGLTRDETESLFSSKDAKPGDPIALFVCQEGWQAFPINTVFTVVVPAPTEWNYPALASIIGRVLLAGREHENAHANAPADSFGWRPCCRLQFGRFIDRHSRKDVHVDPTIPFLGFRTEKYWYTVALPVFPAQAFTDLLTDPAISTDVRFEMTLSPNAIDSDDLGPSPRLVLRKKGRAR